MNCKLLRVQRSKKINEIRNLIESINETKDAIACSQLFYSDGLDLFTDAEHLHKISENEVNAIAETERLENNAKQIFKIIIHSNRHNDQTKSGSCADK